MKKTEEEAKKKIIKNCFTILTNQKTSLIYHILQSHFGMELEATDNQDRAINLLINRFLHIESDQTYIDCYWIIDINHSTQFNALFEVYTARSIHVLDLCTVES